MATTAAATSAVADAAIVQALPTRAGMVEIRGVVMAAVDRAGLAPHARAGDFREVADQAVDDQEEVDPVGSRVVDAPVAFRAAAVLEHGQVAHAKWAWIGAKHPAAPNSRSRTLFIRTITSLLSTNLRGFLYYTAHHPRSARWLMI